MKLGCLANGPLEDLSLDQDAGLPEDCIKSFVQRLSLDLKLLECLKHFFLLLEVSCFVEVTQENCEEQVEHDDVTHQHQADEID